MDGTPDFLGKDNFPERPIILSPPPVERPLSKLGSHVTGNTLRFAPSSQESAPSDDMPADFQAQRNQSVGFNLQQEFEALKADLDLDLSRSNESGDEKDPKNRQMFENVDSNIGDSHTDISLSSTLLSPSLQASSGPGGVPGGVSGGGSGNRVLSGGPSLVAPSANSPYAGQNSNLSHLSGALGGQNHANNSSHNLSETLMRDHGALSPQVSAGGVNNPQANLGAGNPSGNVANVASGLQSLLLNKNTGAAFGAHLGSAPARPQSVNDFTSLLPRAGGPFGRLPPVGSSSHAGQNSQYAGQSTFYGELLAHTSWLEALSASELVAALDHWCQHLPFDILLTMNSKLHQHVTSGNSSVSHTGQLPQVFAPTPADAFSQYQPDFTDLDTFADHTRAHTAAPAPVPAGSDLLQPKPKANAFKSHLFADPRVQRPKSADPQMSMSMQYMHPRGPAPFAPGTNTNTNNSNGNGNGTAADRARSPTSHLYEKTNFLQLAAAHPAHSHGHGHNFSHISGNPGSANPNLNSHGNGNGNFSANSAAAATANAGSSSTTPVGIDENYDHSAAHKLGALATINSRVALDYNRKVYGQTSHRGNPTGPAAYEESLNRHANSSSVPVNPQKYSVAAMTGLPNHAKAPKKDADFGSRPKPPPSSGSATPLSSSSSMPAEIVNQDLLNNIPAWLKLLRLHKYTDYLKDMHWKDLVELSDEDLENKGVKALGARRKLLKAFETVKVTRA